MSFKIVNATNILGGKLQCIHDKEIHNLCEECNNKLNKEQPKMRCTCAKCDITFDNITDYQKHICGMEQYCKHGTNVESICRKCDLEKNGIKMTREEALNKLKTIKTPLSVENIVDILEEVGLLEFEEEKEVKVVFEINNETGDVTDNAYKYGQELVNKYGTIRLELWPEGLVLWVGGEIKWKSWIQYWRKGDGVMIEYYDGLRHEKQKQVGIII